MIDTIDAKLTKATTLYGIGHGHGDRVRVKAGHAVRLTRRLDVDPYRPVYTASIVHNGIEYAANVAEGSWHADTTFQAIDRKYAYDVLVPLYSYEELANTSDEDLLALVVCYRAVELPLEREGILK